MNSAIIGLGGISAVHLKVLKEQRHKIIGACDIDAEKLQNFPAENKFTDYIEMLDTVKPDVVHICTPHYLHARMVIECLNRGINVLCEKPLCINLEEGYQILQAEKNSGAQLGVVHQNRYNLSSLYVKQLLSEESPQTAFATVAWKRDEKYYSSAEWRGKKSTEGGGVIINQALHTLDLLQWLLGMPQQVCASVSTLKLKGVVEVEDTVSAMFYGKRNFQFFATNCADFDYPIQINLKTKNDLINVYTNGVCVNGEKVNLINEFPHKILNRVAGGVYGKQCYGEGHYALIEDFYDCVRTGRKFAVDGEEGFKVIRLIQAVYDCQGEKIDIAK